ncbi:hypothetical protein M2226_003673 [Bradyrhizobium elkanii]|uniref:DUF992 domain-containing protein n=1 Tax=Bradyrhizobium elkanii TaxID=29448 RepID=UPI0022274308|nr:DUF992 domain-containing protein [Bradyrhizobium elkanii]MCW2124929.1 hypothetical protein [Bradyrhizobium elkanii]MCW2171675.1 hypothetical protein [Bradyrhizobium elkanii]
MRLSTILAAALTTTLISPFGATATQQRSPRVQVGLLECRGGASIGFIIGSTNNLACVLRVAGRRDGRYVATINKVGLDFGITENTRLAWTVFAPTTRLGPHDLSGNYAGIDGSAVLGIGIGGNVLVGGSRNSIALQPVSVEDSVGLSVTAGLESLTLRPGR